MRVLHPVCRTFVVAMLGIAPPLFAAEPAPAIRMGTVPQVRSWEAEDFGWISRKAAKLPAFKSEKPRFTWWALGTGKKSAALMVWDESGGTGTGHDVLYFDRDFDGDLTEEGELIAAEPAAKHVYRGGGDAYIVKDVAEADGKAMFHLMFIRNPKGKDHWQSSFGFSMPDPAGAAKPVGYSCSTLPGDLQIAWGDAPESAPVYRLGGPPVMTLGGTFPGQAAGTCKAGAEFSVGPVKAVLGSGSTVQLRFFHAGGPGGSPLVNLRVKSADGDIAEQIPFTGFCACGGNFVQNLAVPRRVPPGQHEVAIRLNREEWNGGPADFVFPVTVENPDFGRDLADPALADLRAKFTGANVRFASLRRAVSPRDLHKAAADEPLVAGRTADTHIMSNSAHWDAKIDGKPAEPLISVGQRQGLNAPDRGLLKFDLSGLPQGAKVLGAAVRLTLVNVPFVAAGADARVDAYAVRREWANELGGPKGLHCSWYGPFYGGNPNNPAQGIVFWKQGGCEDPQEDRYPDPAGSVAVAGFPAKPAANEPAESYRMVSMDVTDTVRRWADGSLANNGLLLVFHQSQGVGWTPICSSENSECMFRPTLVIAYEGGPVVPHLQSAAGEDLEAARAAAAKRGVPLAVKFYSPWCPVSTKVNQTTFQDGAVAKLCAERVELVSLKVEDHPQWAQELGAVQVPMLVVRSADGSRTLATVEADVLRDAKACATRLAEIAPAQ